MKEAMDQVPSERVKELIDHSFTILNSFLKDKNSSDFLEELKEKLTMMELEGRF